MFCWLHGFVDVWCGCGPASFPDLSGVREGQKWTDRMYRSISGIEPFVRTHE